MTFWDKYKFRIFHPNVLTISRGVIGLFLPAMILQRNPWVHLLALFLFIMGGVTDYWDGKIARKHNLESPLGRFIDPFSDKILILGPLVAFAALNFYSIWWVVPIVVREIVVTFCRTGWLIEGKSLGAEMMGKRKFGFQVAMVSVGFLYLLIKPFPILGVLTSIVYYAIPVLMIITIFLTLVSGGTFLWNQRAHFASEAFNRYVLAVGVGFLPKAPGTWGSLFGLLLVFLTRWNGYLYGMVFIFLMVWGALAYRKITDPDPDPQYIVIDEVCGIFVTFMLIPWTWVTASLGFLLFRLFDIFKPFPIRSLERIPGYWGILADDLGAGFCAWIILFLLFR
ncbi:MAG TPA: phosphatidylglycerophosphatase A [Candidatus Omnitrophota bacterium]|nr:phosphatidylglycerophosphatase A [Candidatus Omnitrophota bacterium]HPS37523.1 phosphatidylglycerophosphatase A [Candidatus Omnitrophota bacterium]